MVSKYHASLLPRLILAVFLFGFTSADVTRGTIILKRGADASSITSTLVSDVYAEADDLSVPSEACDSFDGVVSFSHPMSLVPGDKFFSTGQLQLKSIEMMVDEINTQRCGVRVAGKRYGIQLTTYGDDSSKDKVGAIVENAMLPIAGDAQSAAASFWLGPYSSGLTGIMSPHANRTNTVLVAGGAASTPVFRDNPTIFGTFPPTSQYLAQAIEALAAQGATSVSSVWEKASFTAGVCAALDDLALKHGLEIRSQTEVPASPTAEDLDPAARNVSLLDPDVVVTCVYADGCAGWISSLRKAKWTPNAQVFTVCIGMDSFLEAVGPYDAMHMTGISPWDPSLTGADAVVGWSASEFASRFFDYAARTPTYHSASAAASAGALVQAIEAADSFDSAKVATVLSTGAFPTLYGRLSFDDNGQSKAPSLFLQYDENAEVQTVYPLLSRSGALVYPMPTWENRDCTFLSACETGDGSAYHVPGTCREDGSCDCGEGSHAISEGNGPDASCIIVPEENTTYISSGLIPLGLSLYALQVLLVIFCVAWTMFYRKRSVIRSSQPIFLCLVAFGVLVLSSTLIPIGIQGKYRYVQVPTTGLLLTDQPDPDIGKVDAACMAVPWLFSMGFSIIFSALFAKIWRVMRVLKAARRFQRKKVEPKDVAFIMICVVAVQMLILLCWQLIDPLQWHREIVSSDVNGYVTQSVGYCKSDSSLLFLGPLLAIDGMMLLYALYLCYVTRNENSDLQEGQWITGTVLSIVQILIISIPILIIVENNNDAFYFVRAAVIFLMGFTVMGLIFFPKIYRLHVVANQAHGPDGGATAISGIGGGRMRYAASRNTVAVPSLVASQNRSSQNRWSLGSQSAGVGSNSASQMQSVDEAENDNGVRNSESKKVSFVCDNKSVSSSADDASRDRLRSRCSGGIDESQGPEQASGATGLENQSLQTTDGSDRTQEASGASKKVVVEEKVNAKGQTSYQV